MAKSLKQRQDEYRRKRYDAGYKQMRVWVPRDSESETAKLERQMFLARLEALTAGWSDAKLSKFLSRVLRTVKQTIKEETKK